MIVAKYVDRKLPRYTSYPTAAAFTGAARARFLESQLTALPENTPLSIYVHVPFCRSQCLYCGCNTVCGAPIARIESYAVALMAEIDKIADKLDGRGHVAAIHFGGGTPLSLDPAVFAALMDRLRSRFALASTCETAIEIDPRTASDAHIDVLAQAGVSRASLGVQTLEPVVQRHIARVHSFEMIETIVQKLRAAGVANLSFDLMTGLPGQTCSGVGETAALLATLAPDRLAVFGYAHVPFMKPHQAVLEALGLPDGPSRWAQYRAAFDTLVESCYIPIGIDHFTKPKDSLARALAEGRLKRNFQGYTDDPGEILIGIGASAISTFAGGYVQNAADIDTYMKRIASNEWASERGLVLSEDDRRRRAVIASLMCTLAAETQGFDTERKKLAPLIADGLAEVNGTRVIVPEEARPFARLVAATFDTAYDPASARGAPAI